MSDKKLISIVTTCYNEEGNVADLHGKVRDVFEKIGKYDYEHIFIDNASVDGTVRVLKELAGKDPRVKIIVNARNFGVIRSGYYGMKQAYGDAVIAIAADLQEPPSTIPEFIKKWEEGYKVVRGVKVLSKENPIMYGIRSFYYYLVDRLSDIKQSRHFTGFGLYDRQVMDALREIDDPYPYFRGIISELGFEGVDIPYIQEKRKKGNTSYNFYELYDTAMLGITSHSKIPLRLATFAGFAMSFVSFVVAIGYLIAKLIFWPMFPFGLAPLIIGIFFFSSIQLFFIGILGEYIGLMHMRILKRPLVVVKERVNFTNGPHKKS
jgi:glycosyltransferase involved in cell wall biosynthesis